MKERSESPYLNWIRQHPCCVCHRLGQSDAAHVVSRGAGGKDAGNVVPLCRRPDHPSFGCHAEQHILGVHEFERKHRIDLRTMAESFHRAWLDGLRHREATPFLPW